MIIYLLANLAHITMTFGLFLIHVLHPCLIVNCLMYI